MLSDLYPPEQRSRVISVLGMGPSLGALLALLLGAWLAQHHGWRMTLVLVGLSAAALTVLLWFTVQEPLRQPVQAHETPVRGTLHELWHQPVTRWLIVGAAFALMASYGFGAWNNAMLIRRHELTLQQAGWISGAAALASMLGTLWSGFMTDHLTRRHPRWQLGVPLLGLAGALPFGLAYLKLPAGAWTAATVLLVAYAFFFVWWASPVYAALSFLVPPQRRASAHAVMMIVGSVAGSGLGPIVTGWLSDLIQPHLPGDGLRLALMAVASMMVPSMLAFYRVMRLYPGARLRQPFP